MVRAGITMIKTIGITEKKLRSEAILVAKKVWR
jgi:hypothetical protein